MDLPNPHTIDDAVALQRSGQLDEAGAIYQAILQQQPDHADALHLLGQLQIQQGNHAAAFGLIRRATELRPDNPVFYCSLGVALKGMGHFDAAVASHDMALAIQSDYAEAYYNRGNALVELQQTAQALASYDEAIRLKPDHAEAHYNRGNALRALCDIPAAIASYDRAICINSQHTDARLSLGNALHDSGLIDAAKASYDSVITQDAGCTQALWGKSLSLLLSGEFEAGWRLYESRWEQPFGQSQRRDFAQPLWLGREPLAGRTLLLHSEQGLGDTIQFCRYARLAAERGARVVLEVPGALAALMGTLAGVDQVVSQGQALPAFDLHCPLMSLPLAFDTRVDTIPASAAYLRSEPQRLEHWRERLGPRRAALRIGLVWSGSTGNVNDAKRSLSLAALLAHLPDAFEYVSVQKELRSADAATLETSGMRHFGDELRDFSDTAALCDLMDLVISVDTSVAHLSGALGKTTKVLVQYVPDFRWLLGRTDSPWYPSVTLLRQQADGGWASVLEQLQAELSGLIKTAPSPEARDDDSLFMQALELHGRDDLAAAHSLYQQVLAEKIRHFGALHMLGAIEIKQGRHAIAVEWLCKALEVNLQSAEAFHDLGCAVCLLKQYDAGVECFDKALALRPSFAAAHCDRGNALLDLGQPQEALASQEQALAIEPELALAHVYRGNALQALARLPDAVAAYDRALSLDATLAEAHLNRGNALQALDDFAAAVASYDQAIALRPDDTVAWVNRCSALKREHRLDAALASCDRAIAIDPECVSAHWNKSLALLLAGELRSGFALYEWRWKTEAFVPIARHFDQPLWLGHEPIAGKTVLVHTEQGLGDTLQFVRYVQPLAAAGARVVLEVQPPLFELLQSLAGVALLVQRGDALPPFDFHCPTLSLPLALGTELHSVPADVPYLRADAARVAGWSKRLGERTLQRIGLVWSGSHSHQDDRHRSIALSSLLAELPAGFDFVSLQKHVRESDRATLSSASHIADFGDALHDFADTAALCSLMDVVISVDSSVAHLAGALGVPTWVLLPHTPDWRWLLGRGDSPWYPSARLYRQDAGRQWAPVLQRVAADLRSPPSMSSAGVDGCPSHFEQGLRFQQQGALEQAKAAYLQVLAQQPAHFDALHMLGVVEVNLGHADAGVDWLCKALEVDANSAAAFSSLGHAMCVLKQYDAGVECYDKALALQPQFAQAHGDRGSALLELGRPLEALACYERAIAIQPDDAVAHCNRGTALLSLGRAREAVASHDRALALHSDLPEAWLNRGNAFQALDDNEAAVASYDRAIAYRPNYPMAFANRCSALQELHRLDEAIASCDQAIALDAGFTEAWWNKSLALLLKGELREGFELYQRRWQMDPFTTIARHFKQPLWLGDAPIAGKTLLIHSEQGLGDTVQFARFARQVSAAGARVVFEVEKPLFGLFHDLAGVDVLVRQGDALPDFDFHCPTMSLPIGCRTDLSTLSAAAPYLRADAAKVAAWSARLGTATRPRIGLVCSGSTTHKNDHHRSIALAELMGVLPVGIECISLQKEWRECDRQAAKGDHGIAFFGDELHDFADTAALCSLMDVVISVDTSVAHLAGALGVPTWVLLPHTPDWRWLLDRDDSPWYPSARLYRQDASRQWAPVLQRVAADLRQL